MNAPRTLRSWLGRPVRPSGPLGCERLEDRTTPTVDPSGGRLLGSAPRLADLPTTSDLVVRTASAQPLADLRNVAAALGLTTSIDPDRSRVAFTDGPTAVVQVALRPGAAVPFLVDALSGTGLYSSVSPNYVYPTGRGGGADLRELVPNDPQFTAQYALPVVRAPQAWDKTVGTPSVVTAVLDDGLDARHPDLAPNLWVNPREVAGNNADDDGDGFVDDVNGYDFVNDRGDVTPDDPTVDTHGTEVAGVIAARINNGSGVAGVAGGSRLMPLKVVGAGPTTSLVIARAVNFAVAHGAKIINSSLNVDPFVGDPTFEAALTFAYDHGVLWVNSAGNLNVLDPPRQAFEQTLLVGATDRDDVKTPYSNYGRGLDLAAPGGLTGDGVLTTAPGGGTAQASGTSVSAAVVSGVAALVWSANPTYTRDQVASVLMTQADGILAKNPDLTDLFGAGRVNAERALSGPGLTRLGPLTGLPADGATTAGTVTAFGLRLEAPLDPASVNTRNLELRWAGPDDRLGTADDAVIPLDINNGDPIRVGTNALNFAVAGGLRNGLYRFTVRNLLDPFGRAVDADGDGTPGGTLTRTFRVGFQVSGRVFEDTGNSGYPTPTSPGVGGRTVYADRNGNGALDRVAFPASPGGSVPDDSPGGAAVPVTVGGVEGTVGGLTVSVLVDHPSPSDLIITLTAPDGRTITLVRNRAFPAGPSSLNVFSFADGNDDSTVSDSTSSRHQLAPDDPLALLAGGPANGTWVIRVIDATGGASGAVLSASLSVANEPTAVTGPDGTFTLAGLPDGPVRIDVLPGPGFTRSADGQPVGVVVSPDRAVQADLGVVRTSGVYGRVTRDDGDGRFGPGDAGLAGVTVFLDGNGNGVPDPGEPQTATDENGNYVFGPLAFGGYRAVVVPPAGFTLVPGVSALRAVTLTAATPVSTGNDFLFARNTGPVTVTLGPVSPADRGTPVGVVAVTLSEPLPDLSVGDFTLTRDGQPVPLTGVTLFGTGGRLTLAGLAGLTAADGAYTLSVVAPPPGEPGRRPAPASVSFTVDTRALTAALTPERSDPLGPVDSVRVTFNRPVLGVPVEAFRLIRDGAFAPLVGAAVQQLSATDFRLTGLAGATAARGLYTLTLPGTGVTDEQGNPVAGLPTAVFRVGPAPRPRAGQAAVIGGGAGGPPTVAVYDPTTGRVTRMFDAFDSSFTGGVRVAAADVNGDGVQDVIAATGPGAEPRVRVFDGATGLMILDLLAFEPEFRGGVLVSAGDLDGDGRAEIVFSADVGGGPRVAVVDGTGTRLADFFGVGDPDFRGGARTGVGDLDGDGAAELIVTAGLGGGPRTAIFSGRSVTAGNPTRTIGDFFVFEDSLRNGAFVTAADVDGDGFADLIAGAGPGGGPRVTIFSGAALAAGRVQILSTFFAGDMTSRTGVRVAAKDADGDGMAEVVAADGGGLSGAARVYFGRDLLSGNPTPPVGMFLSSFDGFGDGVYVG